MGALYLKKWSFLSKIFQEIKCESGVGYPARLIFKHKGTDKLSVTYKNSGTIALICPLGNFPESKIREPKQIERQQHEVWPTVIRLTHGSTLFGYRSS